MSLYSIDSAILDIYSDIVYEDFMEKAETRRIINEIYDMYQVESPIPDFKPCKNIFKIKAFSNYIGKKNMLSFGIGQEFYVLSTDKIKKTYIVTTDKNSPFSSQSVSGEVPSYYFNKIG